MNGSGMAMGSWNQHRNSSEPLISTHGTREEAHSAAAPYNAHPQEEHHAGNPQDSDGDAAETAKKEKESRLRRYLFGGFILNVSLWVLLAAESIWPSSFKIYQWIFLGYWALGVAVVILGMLVSWSKIESKIEGPGRLAVIDGIDCGNALICWNLTLAYLLTGALPAYYHHPTWELSTQYNTTLNAPGFSIVGGYEDSAMAAMYDSNRCTFPQYDKPCEETTWPSKSASFSLAHYGPDLSAFHLDAPNITFDNTWDDLVLQINVSYNLAKLQNAYQEQAVQTPYLFAAMYDPRIANLSAAIDCGLVGLTEVPALASNTFRFAAAYVKDEQDKIRFSNSTTECPEVYRKAFELENPPYTAYTFYIASMPISETSLCDTSIDPAAQCIMQSILRIDKPVIESMESVPGVEWSDVWLNVAAIIGGVQFFYWIGQVLLSR